MSRKTRKRGGAPAGVVRSEPSKRQNAPPQRESRSLAGGVLLGFFVLAAGLFVWRAHHLGGSANTQVVIRPPGTNSSATWPIPARTSNAVPAVPSTPAPTNTAEAETPAVKSGRLVTEGNQNFRAGKIDEAIADYQQAVRLMPEEESIHFNLGIALMESKQDAAAEKEFLEALRIYPDYPEAHNNLGEILLRRGQTQAAITHLKAAIKAQPDYALAYNNLGVGMRILGNKREAEADFKAAIRIQPGYAEAHYNLGDTYYVQNQFEPAINELKEALHWNPDLSKARRLLDLARRRSNAPLIEPQP